jgi:hypothetical protein
VRDVYGAAAMKGRAPMTETLEEVAAVAEARPARDRPAAGSAEPSLFESFTAEDIPERPAGVETADDGVPPRPTVPPPRRRSRRRPPPSR